ALAENMRGKVGTWVNSQWKYHATPGQFSVAINTKEDAYEKLEKLIAEDAGSDGAVWTDGDLRWLSDH
ncbi:hypothetical protein ACQZ5N_25490, partial [Agrobacterium sp. 22-221-1]